MKEKKIGVKRIQKKSRNRIKLFTLFIGFEFFTKTSFAPTDKDFMKF